MHMSHAVHSVPWHWTYHTDTDSVVPHHLRVSQRTFVRCTRTDTRVEWNGDFLATLYTSTNTVPFQKHAQITVYDDSSLYVAVHCPAGTFAGEKQQLCTRCPRGFYQNRDRQGSCIRCPMGTYTREEGTSSYTVLYAPVTLLFVTRHHLEHSCLQECDVIWSGRYASLHTVLFVFTVGRIRVRSRIKVQLGG
jgi:hypothetical protein